MSSEISSLTEGQELALALLPIPSALASILGSSLIIYMVVKAQRKTPYQRILFGMSMADIITSFAMTIQPWLVPEETSTRALAVGNERTCSFLGFLWQLSFSTILYNGSLSTYYLLTIRFGIPEWKLSRRIEPAMHLFSVGFPLVTAIVGVAMGMFAENELGVGCWINDYPRNCGDDYDQGETGERCLGAIIGWLFGGIPVFIASLVILTNNVIIYVYVRRTIYRSRRRHLSYLVATARTTATTEISGRRQIQITDSQTKRVREVATQAALYVLAFFFTYAWAILVRAMESVGFDAENEDQIFPFLVLMCIFSPLTGVLNLFVFLRPRYLRTRGDFPRERRVWAARRALFGDVVEPEEVQRRPPSTSTPTLHEEVAVAKSALLYNQNRAGILSPQVPEKNAVSVNDDAECREEPQKAGERAGGSGEDEYDKEFTSNEETEGPSESLPVLGKDVPSGMIVTDENVVPEARADEDT